jgi:endonuclease/exonuclease/phosphatase (EEP) superfamily protein YafD
MPLVPRRLQSATVSQALNRVFRFLHGGLIRLGVLAAVFTFLGFAGQVWWVFSFLGHPRPQYALILLMAFGLGVLNRKPIQQKRWQVLWLLPLLLNLWLISPTGHGSQSAHTGMLLKVAHVTLDHTQHNLQPVIDYLERLQADVVSILEVTPTSLPQLQAGLNHYQPVAASPHPDSKGTAWFIAKHPRLPLKPSQHRVIHLPQDSDRPILETMILVGNRQVTFLCFQAIRPSDGERLAYQVQEFNALSQWSQTALTQKQDLVVMGDFNDTPWSGRFLQLLVASGLHLAKTGLGVYPTWHTSLPRFLQIPIDHCLLSPSLAAHRYSVGNRINSDHAPIVVELALS